MIVSTNNTPKNYTKENTTNNEDQRTIERLRFLLKNAIQLNEELEKKNALLLYRIEQQSNLSQQSIQQEDYKQQLAKLQKQLSESQSENQHLQSCLRNLKQLANKNNKKNFELILQDCAVSQIEKQFYEYFEKSSTVLQEQMILEFQNILEKYQTKYQIVEIHKITSFTNLEKTKCIESQQKEIDNLELKLNNTEKELCDLKRILESFQQQQSMKSSQQVHDFFNSNQFEVFTSRLNNSQGMDECLSTDKSLKQMRENQSNMKRSQTIKNKKQRVFKSKYQIYLKKKINQNYKIKNYQLFYINKQKPVKELYLIYNQKQKNNLSRYQ